MQWQYLVLHQVCVQIQARTCVPGVNGVYPADCRADPRSARFNCTVCSSSPDLQHFFWMWNHYWENNRKLNQSPSLILSYKQNRVFLSMFFFFCSACQRAVFVDPQVCSSSFSPFIRITAQKQNILLAFQLLRQTKCVCFF